jgi:hypothetical protein
VNVQRSLRAVRTNKRRIDRIGACASNVVNCVPQYVVWVLALVKDDKGLSLAQGFREGPSDWRVLSTVHSKLTHVSPPGNIHLYQYDKCDQRKDVL